MTAVAASPAAVRALADVLADVSAFSAGSGRELRAAVERFVATNGELGPAARDVPDLLEAEARHAAAMSMRLGEFADALLAADQAGAALTIGRPLGLADADVLLVDSAAVALAAPLRPGATMHDLIAATEADLRHHHRLEPAAHGDELRRWRVEHDDLAARLQQYRAVVDPPHGGGWAAAGDQWLSAADFLNAVEATNAELADRLLPGSAGGLEARRWHLDSRLVETVGPDRPFLRAALRHGALLTPQRLAIVDDLDGLATMPLHEFLHARAHAMADRPALDWTADGCSGPIPPGGQQTCLRHDFLYRNARMLRDQWGLADGFANDIKAVADKRFGDELHDSYSRLDLVLDPLLFSWLEVAELAVRQFGDVSEPWSPPPAGRFHGSAAPHR